MSRLAKIVAVAGLLGVAATSSSFASPQATGWYSSHPRTWRAEYYAPASTYAPQSYGYAYQGQFAPRRWSNVDIEAVRAFERR